MTVYLAVHAVQHCTIQQLDENMALVESEATIICSDGVASYLVNCAGRELSVHARYIRFRRLTAGETVYRIHTGRAGTVLANTAYHEPVRLRWSDGQEARLLPECIESETERQQRLAAEAAKKNAKKAARISALEERMEAWRR